MTSSRASLALILVAFVVALVFRIPYLNLRPFHGDEANQAYKAGILLETGKYTYDPVEHHGPIIYYLALPVAWLTTNGTFADTTETTYRIVPVIFGAALVLLLWPLRHALGTRATFIAALFTAISPAMVFYSRYYIQEMLLVFFAFGAIVAARRYTQRPSIAAAVACGLCLGLAQTSKETCIITFAGYAGAGICTIMWGRLRDGEHPSLTFPRALNMKHVAIGVVAGAAISVLFFSSFFTHWRGVADSILTYANYTNKANTPHMHDKPWYYYLQMLVLTKHAPYPWFSEALILGLGAIGIRTALTAQRSAAPHVGLLRFLAFYTLLLTAAYSIIPYKTPWCAINFLQPLIVMAGIGADALIRGFRPRLLQAAVAIFLALLTLQLARQTCLANYEYYADPRNPYVYAHTSGSITQLGHQLDDIAAVAPDKFNTTVAVMSPTRDYWPLPWYLRKFKKVGFFDQLPAEKTSPLYTAPIVMVTPPVIIHTVTLGETGDEIARQYNVTTEVLLSMNGPDASNPTEGAQLAIPIAAAMNTALGDGYFSATHALRPRVLINLFVRDALWDAYIATRATPTIGE
ncbi:MAG: TIGR03663 family protein [Candidatus Hydrogenedentes bacterium]|nr:TIGR03663 family protein [Candidatus Hydrogenedentota bacterium]